MQRLARALFQQGHADKCLEKMKAAYDLDSRKDAEKRTVPTPELVLGQLYADYPDPTNAKIWMMAALEKTASARVAEQVNALVTVAQWALNYVGNLDDAKKYASKAVQLDPKSLPAKIVRGVVYLFQQDYKDAEADFAAALDLSPSNFAASNNLALALCEQKDDLKKNRALEYAQINAQRYPKMAEAASTLAGSSIGWDT